MSTAAPKTRAARLLKAFHEEQTDVPVGDLGLLKRVLPFMRPHAGLFVVAFVMMPLASLGPWLQPLLVKHAIDDVVVSRSASMLATTVGYFALVVLIEFFARFAQVYLMQLAGQRTMADVRRAVFRHVQSLAVGYFDRTPIGRVTTRVTNDVDTLGELFASGAVTAVADVLVLAGIVVFMVSLDWRLSLIAFAAVLPLGVAVELIRRQLRVAYRVIRLKTAQLNAYLSEQTQGVAIVQAYGREDACAAEYAEINEDYRRANYASIRYDAMLFSVVESVASACIALVLWYAAVRLGVASERGQGAAYVGTLVAFYEYIQRFFVPIRELSGKYTIVQSSITSAERIFSFLDTVQPDAPSSATVPPAPPVPADVAIAFRDVHFAYREGEPVLHGISFDVKRGEKVAVVGATGAGKTTLTGLLLRLYEVSSGHVLLDGVDVRTLDRHALRRRFAVVPQDVFLFTGDVLANIALGDTRPDEARAREALMRVGAWPMVEARGGLGTSVGERGGNFSAGERQLLAFARALYRDPQVLLLDEATANVDSETEGALQAAVEEVLAGRTAMVIAHRLSTIRSADRILVLHKGRLAEQGTHAELLALNGIYARLHALQFGTEDGAARAAE